MCLMQAVLETGAGQEGSFKIECVYGQSCGMREKRLICH